MNWKGLACAAAAALACGSAAFAADSDQSSIPAVTSMVTPNYLDDTTAPAPAPAPPAASAPSETTLTPVMFLLDPTPVGQWLEKNKFSITGFFDGGFFYDTNNPQAGAIPPGNNPTDIFFPGQYSNHFMVNQLDLILSKGLDTTKSWDWGFLFENGYGVDDSYIHSNGMLNTRPPGNPVNQYDIIQANVQFYLPVGTGLTLTAGKFVSLLSEEVINPTGNAFYTHSYNFFFGVPATNTGILGSYTFSKLVNGNDWTFTGGITEGWNQSLRNNNGDIDGLFQFKGNITSKLSLVTNLEVGPEQAGNDSDYWTGVEAIPTYAVSDQLTVAGDFLYYDAVGAAVTPGGNAAQWYGAALYGNYKFNSMFAFNIRTEWYRDQGGFSVGGTNQGVATSANYYEATVGCQIHPLPNDNILQWLQFRPELRVDWSDRPVYNQAHVGSGGLTGDYSELTFAFDALMQF
jgi:Putative beta-barrel porin-2, OmpL-like. bbp2